MTQNLNDASKRNSSLSNWFDNLPVNWHTSRLKYVTKVNPSKTEISSLPNDTEVSFLPMEKIGVGSLDLDQVRRKEQVFQGFTYFKEGDVLVAKITPCFENNKGAIAYALKNIIGFGTTELHVIRPNRELDRKYLYYLTMSGHFRELGVGYMQGTAGQKRVPEAFLLDLVVPIPPLSEQKTIVTFLDRETARIDDLIAKYQKVIGLLNEKRTVLVDETAIQGLDNLKLKETGLVWLGKIPSFWDIQKNGYLFIERNERGFPDLPLLNVSIHSGVTIRQFSDEHIEQMASDWSTYKKACKGDIAFNKMRMWQGAVGVAPVDGLVSPDYTVAKPKVGTNPYYYEYLFRTKRYMDEVNRFSHGIVPDRNRLYWDQFKQMSSPYPPPDEQQKIVDYLDSATQNIQDLLNKIEIMINRLLEYRTTLISSAVTGKIDLQPAQANVTIQEAP